jgi:hypothetical protein
MLLTSITRHPDVLAVSAVIASQRLRPALEDVGLVPATRDVIEVDRARAAPIVGFLMYDSSLPGEH